MNINITPYQHWRLQVNAEGVVWATLDKAGESTNSLSTVVMSELAGILDQFDSNPPKGLVFRSGKSAGFIAGADIQEFTQVASAERIRIDRAKPRSCLLYTSPGHRRPLCQ